MAHVNSILGKGLSGKLGNLIFQRYKNKTVVRSLNTSISVQPSESQIRAQNKFKNCKRAYIFTDSFFRNLYLYNPKFHTIESLYFKLYYKYFNDNEYVSDLNSFLSLRGTEIKGNQFCVITSIEPITIGAYTDGTLIRFDHYLPFDQVNPIINILIVDGQELVSYVSEFEISEQEWNEGIYKHLVMSNINTMPAAYISSSKLKSISNILFT